VVRTLPPHTPLATLFLIEYLNTIQEGGRRERRKGGGQSMFNTEKVITDFQI